MVKYTVSYIDYNNKPGQQDIWFHISISNVLLSKSETFTSIVDKAKELQNKIPEIEKIQKSIPEGETKLDPLSEESLVMANTMRDLAELFDDIVSLSYGVRDESGIKFVKNEEVLRDFKDSVVYDAFLQEMLGDPQKIITFINAVVK